MHPLLIASMLFLGLSFAVAVAAPAPSRPPRFEATVFALVLLGCLLTLGLSLMLALIDLWIESAACALLACAMVLPFLWLARAYNQHWDDGEDSDDDGGRPRLPLPPGPTAPGDGPDLDWSAFDSLRVGWERSGSGDPDRTPIPT